MHLVGYLYEEVEVEVVCVHSTWNNTAPIVRIFTKFDIWAYFKKSVEKIQVSLKSDKYNSYCTWRPMYIYDYIWLNSS
jgi:hypothetical protein